jgi:hypothetical protein
MDLKNNLISLTMCVDDKQGITHLPYKVNTTKQDNITTSFDNEILEKDEINFTDILKNSAFEYKNRNPSRELLEDIIKSDDEIKSKNY